MRLAATSLVVCLSWLTIVAAQCEAADPAKVPSVPTANSDALGPFRNNVPGVEITISPNAEEAETFSTHDVIELLQGVPDLKWQPKLSADTQTLAEMATKTIFRRDIWCLEFTFKPVRMMWVDVPQANGRMQRKLIWYMVYHVKNTGQHLKPVKQADDTFATQTAERPVRFFPQFVLEAHEYNKAYLDRIIPVAIPAIQRREDPNRPLLNSVEISSKAISPSTELVDRSVWGVATWEDIDPRTDFFSVYIQGLTNAYKWVDPPGAFKPGDAPTSGRRLFAKTLQLNFWRPGDEFVEDQRTIRYGMPGKVDYSWVYR